MAIQQNMELDIVEPLVQQIIARDQDDRHQNRNQAGNEYLRGVAKRNVLILEHFN